MENARKFQTSLGSKHPPGAGTRYVCNMHVQMNTAHWGMGTETGAWEQEALLEPTLLSLMLYLSSVSTISYKMVSTYESRVFCSSEVLASPNLRWLVSLQKAAINTQDT